MPTRARRSCLSIPGSEPRFHARAVEIPADEVIFDLEDSVAPAAKERARVLVVAALREHDYRGKVRAVRVNACDTRWCFDDFRHIVEEAGDRLDTIVLPKAEGPDHVHFAAHLLNQLEWKLGLQHQIGLELQIESARGLEQVERVAGASRRTEALMFGPGDFAASMRMPGLTIGATAEDYPGDLWHYFVARIAVAARARGLQAVDGPYAQVHDLPGLRAAAQRAALLGYDGKWAIHPGQVEVLNEVFSPTQADLDRAIAILDVYAQASDVDQTGAVAMGDEMIDEATRKMAAVTAERGRAAGMTPR